MRIAPLPLSARCTNALLSCLAAASVPPSTPSAWVALRLPRSRSQRKAARFRDVAQGKGVVGAASGALIQRRASRRLPRWRSANTRIAGGIRASPPRAIRLGRSTSGRARCGQRRARGRRRPPGTRGDRDRARASLPRPRDGRRCGRAQRCHNVSQHALGWNCSVQWLSSAMSMLHRPHGARQPTHPPRRAPGKRRSACSSCCPDSDAARMGAASISWRNAHSRGSSAARQRTGERAGQTCDHGSARCAARSETHGCPTP